MASDDSNLIWSTATCGELLQRLNANCVEHVKRGDMEKASHYARISGIVEDAMKEVGLNGKKEIACDLRNLSD